MKVLPLPSPVCGAMSHCQLQLRLCILMTCGVWACAPATTDSPTGTGGNSGKGTGGAVASGGSSSSSGGSGTGGSGSGGASSSSGGATASTGGTSGTGGTTMASGGTGAGSGGNVGSGGTQIGSGGRGSGGNGNGGATATGGVGVAGATGSSGCGASGLMICEDFEGATEGSKTVAGWTSVGAVTVATDQAHRGTKSLKIGAALSGERLIRRTTTLAGGSISTVHWGRIFFRVSTPTPVPTGNNVVHSTIVAGDGNVSAGKVQVRVVDTLIDSKGMIQYMYNVQQSYGSSGEHGRFSNHDWKYENVWKCAEWQIDSGAKSYHFYVDNQEITSIGFANASVYGRDPEMPPTFSSMQFGWNNYQQAPSPGFVAWIDDIAVGPTRIGCN